VDRTEHPVAVDQQFAPERVGPTYKVFAERRNCLTPSVAVRSCPYRTANRLVVGPRARRRRERLPRDYLLVFYTYRAWDENSSV
jgi:hypothetical protein